MELRIIFYLPVVAVIIGTLRVTPYLGYPLDILAQLSLNQLHISVMNCKWLHLMMMKRMMMRKMKRTVTWMMMERFVLYKVIRLQYVVANFLEE